MAVARSQSISNHASLYFSRRGGICLVRQGKVVLTKLPTRMQYTNCRTPTTARKARNESSSLTRWGVCET